MNRRRIGRGLLALGVVMAVAAAFVWHREHSVNGPLSGKTTVQGLFYSNDESPNHAAAIVLYAAAIASVASPVVLLRLRRPGLPS